MILPSAKAIRDAPSDLIAVHGDLEPNTLLAAYRLGLFPWYASKQPILWHSPNPRFVLDTPNIRISRSLQKSLRRSDWACEVNARFDEVILACAAREDTWILPEMRAAYCQLHRLGYAHSIAITVGDDLVGGLYGVGIGCMFFGESMFSRRADASKIALVLLCGHLRKNGCALIDCQVESEHLSRLGARPMPRAEFMREIETLCAQTAPQTLWARQALRYP